MEVHIKQCEFYTVFEVPDRVLSEPALFRRSKDPKRPTPFEELIERWKADREAEEKAGIAADVGRKHAMRGGDAA